MLVGRILPDGGSVVSKLLTQGRVNGHPFKASRLDALAVASQVYTDAYMQQVGTMIMAIYCQKLSAIVQSWIRGSHARNCHCHAVDLLLAPSELGQLYCKRFKCRQVLVCEWTRGVKCPCGFSLYLGS